MHKRAWTEGEQLITIDPSWQVIRLDQHKYYKRLSGLGLKAADFMILDPTWGLYLVELKDYALRDTPVDSAALSTILEAKRNDSIQIIRVINKALRRQWYYRWIFLRLRWYHLCPSEWRTWHNAYICIEEGRVLFIGDVRVKKMVYS